jgi:hypothetical protein
MEGTKNFSVNDRTAYANSFGLMENHTAYYNPNSELDMRSELKSFLDKGMEEQKALTVTGGNAGTAGYALIPVYVDPRIVDRTRKFTPWGEIIQRVTNQGITADFNYISSKGGGFTAVEDAPLTDAVDTESRSSTAIKYLYAVGRVTGQMFASMPSYMVQGMMPSGTGTDTASFGSPMAQNAKQYEVLKRARAIKELEENLIWNGNATTSGINGNPNGTEFNGIVAQQSTTNQNDKNDAELEFDDVEDTVRYAFDDSGRPDVAGCDSSTSADLRKIMMNTFNIRPNDLGGTTGFGIPARMILETMVGPVPVIPSQYLSSTTGEKQLFFLDSEYMEMRVLQDMTYEEKASVTDSQKFTLKIYETLLLRAPQFNAFVDNIK